MTPEREEFPGLTRDLGDYRATMDLVRIGHAVHVVRFVLEPKNPGRHTITGETLRATARVLADMAERTLAEHLTTDVDELGAGTLTITTAAGARWVEDVPGARVTHHNQAEAERLAQTFATRRREQLTDEDLAEIAEIVTRAQADRLPIQAAVAAARSVTPSRAGHLIKITRDRGFLPPASKRGSRRAQDQ